jgi:hypothetical protein
MAKKMTHTAAFKEFGTTPRNVNWSWSSRNEATKTVVVTLWQDEFDYRVGSSGKKEPHYAATRVWDAARKSNGMKEMFDNLQWALDNCDGVVRVIMAKAKDTTARPRSIAECFPWSVRMRVTSVDHSTASFTLGPDNPA